MVCGFEKALSIFGLVRTTWHANVLPCELLAECTENSLKKWRKERGDADIEAAISDIKLAVGEENYPSEDLAIAVQVPVTLLLRRAVVKAAKQNQDDGG